MPEENRSTRKTSSASFLLNLVDRVFGTVETFVSQLMTIVSESADGVVSRAVQKLFGLLLIMVGIGFILSGVAKIINQLLDSVGVGEIVVGALLLCITAIVITLIRKK